MQKKTILLLSDHPLSTSGVGTQARWLINGLISTGKYKFKCFGGAMKHEDYRTIVVNEDFIIKPTNGFGDRNLLRQVLATERPDALMLFTDPRFFIWVWEMEDEIHQICPIAYNHLWDNGPWPEFNKVLYESTDLRKDFQKKPTIFLMEFQKKSIILYLKIILEKTKLRS
jgi:hypothetical protein